MVKTCETCAHLCSDKELGKVCRKHKCLLGDGAKTCNKWQEIGYEKVKTYRVIAKHIYKAHLKYEGQRTLIILADNIEEATEKAVKAFGLNSVFVKRIDPTEDPQVYEV